MDTSEVAQADAEGVEQTLKSLRYGEEASPPRHPDSFRYEIHVGEGDQRRSAQLDEAELPEGLRPIVDAALARGTVD